MRKGSQEGDVEAGQLSMLRRRPQGSPQVTKVANVLCHQLQLGLAHVQWSATSGSLYTPSTSPGTARHLFYRSKQPTWQTADAPAQRQAASIGSERHQIDLDQFRCRPAGAEDESGARWPVRHGAKSAKRVMCVCATRRHQPLDWPLLLSTINSFFVSKPRNSRWPIEPRFRRFFLKEDLTRSSISS